MKALSPGESGASKGPSSSFKERLRQAVRQHVHPKADGDASVEAGSVAALPEKRGVSAAAVESILGGKWIETEHGRALIVDVEYPLDHTHGGGAIGAFLRSAPSARGCLLPDDLDTPPQAFGFFDIETTGLSGGTGTYCFLAALGTFTENAFRVRQYFLADLLEERAMMTVLTDDLRSCEVVVTYNGRCFDVPCVDTRMLLARFPSPFEHAYNLDLLYTVRRLYRHRLESCRLSDAEQGLLGFQRDDDIPGWMAPSLYFDYLRAGRVAPLRGVLRHNRDDVLSTLGLLAHATELFANESPKPEDAVALARWWEQTGGGERARKLYAGALPKLEGEDDWPWAATRHAFLCKRAGEREEAARWWQRRWEHGDRRAGLELAKHFEHWKRDLLSAERITSDLLDSSTGDDSGALEHRLSRVRRKLSRRGKGRPNRRGAQ